MPLPGAPGGDVVTSPAPVVLRALADELDTINPNDPARYWLIRGRARAHGLDDDTIERLPVPDTDGMRRHEYAARLPTIARTH